MRINIVRTVRQSLAAGTLLAMFAVAGLVNPAWAAANSYLSNKASPSGYHAGSQVFDSATLQGVNPTGTITFKLYEPGDTTCVSPIFTTNTVVNGNGYYQSKVFVTNAAGDYRWTARYNGDAGNHPSATTECGAPAATVSIAKRKPLLNGDASNVTSTGTILNSATLSSASGPTGPTGTLTFNLYGAGDMTCAKGVIFTTSVPVNGEKTYTSAAFRPSVVGAYQWTVAYSGDANNWWAGTTCTDPANKIQVNSVDNGGDDDTTTPPPPSTSVGVAASPTTVKPAGALTATWSNISSPTTTDWVALYAVGAPDSAVVAWKYTNGAPSGSATMTVPWGTSPGNFEVRLSANNSYQRLAKSGGVTIIAP